jgi:hypothetical protein
MHYCIGFLNDGSILPLSQIVLTPSEGQTSSFVVNLSGTRKQKEPTQEYLLKDNNEYISRIKEI